MKKILTHLRAFLKYKWPVVALVLALILIPETVFAADDKSVSEKAGESLAFLLNQVLIFLDKLVWLFLFFIGDLMDSDLIVGPGMEDRLIEIWSQVRNLVNMAFVVVLLVIAFYNVTGLGGEGDFAVKTALPKLILGLILVNFTFLGGKILVDVSAIATNAAFSLPDMLDDSTFDKELKNFLNGACYKSYTIDEGGTSVTHENYLVSDANVPQVTKSVCKVVDGQYTAALDDNAITLFSSYNASNIGLIMAVNHGHLTSLPLIQENVDDFGDLTINALFSVIMFFVFAASYIVLGIMLIFRIVVLWLGIALSPVLVLLWVVPQLSEAAGGAGDLTTKVTKHLLSPIIIGVVMTIGALMIEAMDDVVGGAAFEFGDAKLDEYVEQQVYLNGIGDLQKILIAATSVVVIWVGIFSAASDTFAGEFVGGIRNMGESAGKFISRLPLYANIVPISTGGSGTAPVKISLGALPELSNRLLSMGNSSAMYEDDLEKIRNTFPSIDRALSASGNGIQAALERVSRDTTTFEQARDEVMRFDINENTYRDMARMLSQLVEKNQSYSSRTAKADVQRNLEQAATSGDPARLIDYLRQVAPESQQMFGLTQQWLSTKLNSATTPPPTGGGTPPPTGGGTPPPTGGGTPPTGGGTPPPTGGGTPPTGGGTPPTSRGSR